MKRLDIINIGHVAWAFKPIRQDFHALQALVTSELSDAYLLANFIASTDEHVLMIEDKGDNVAKAQRLLDAWVI